MKNSSYPTDGYLWYYFEDGQGSSPEMLVPTYKSIQHHISKESDPQITECWQEPHTRASTYSTNVRTYTHSINLSVCQMACGNQTSHNAIKTITSLVSKWVTKYTIKIHNVYNAFLIELSSTFSHVDNLNIH